MAEGKLKVYSDEEVTRADPGRWVGSVDPRGWLAAPQVQHRRLADHAHARQRHRLPLRGSLAPRRPVGHLGQALGQAQDPLRRGDHRQGLCPRSQDRGGRPLAPRARRSAGRNAQQVCSDQEVNPDKGAWIQTASNRVSDARYRDAIWSRLWCRPPETTLRPNLQTQSTTGGRAAKIQPSMTASPLRLIRAS